MIPRINVALSRAKGQAQGTLDFNFEADPALLDIPYTAFASPVHAVLSYDIAEDGCVEVTGEISFRLSGSCSRCLDAAEEEVHFRPRALFVPDTPDEDEGEMAYKNGCVELGEFMRESVIFALPATIHCTACKQDESI